MHYHSELVMKNVFHVHFSTGYLCYKTITPQNVSFEAQVKNFLFRRKVMFHSQDVQVFVFLTIP